MVAKFFPGIETKCLNCEYFDIGGEKKLAEANDQSIGDCGHPAGAYFNPTGGSTCDVFYPNTSKYPDYCPED